MKKAFIAILIACIGLLIGCGEKPNPQDEVNMQKVESVILHIEALPIEITETDREYIVEVRAMYDDLNELEKALVTNFDILENAEAVIFVIDQTKEQNAAALSATEAHLDAIIPGIADDDFELPTTYDSEVGTVRIAWASSNPQTITNTGRVIPGRRNISVNLSASIMLESDSEVRSTFSKVVIVRAITMPALPESNLAFAYLYNNTAFRGLSEVASQTLDVINYGFARVTDDGVVSVMGLSQSVDVLSLRKQGIRVSLCIAGYQDGAIPFSKAAQTQAGREKLAASIVDIIQRYHFDGVDIDWEYPGFYTNWAIGLEEDKANYTLLMQEIRRQVKALGHDYLVTAAIPGGPWLPARYNLTDLAPVLDYFLIMTYDLNSGEMSTHHTALYSSSLSVANSSVHDSVNHYLDYGVPANKIIVGAAFYGRQFTLASTSSIMRNSIIATQSITFSQIKINYLDQLAQPHITRYWDDVAKAPYVHNSNTNIVVSYDDPESIRYKCEYIIDRNLGGIMFWEYMQDNTNQLMQSIFDNLTSKR